MSNNSAQFWLLKICFLNNRFYKAENTEWCVCLVLIADLSHNHKQNKEIYIYAPIYIESG